jgi:hypothetical protein
MDTEFYAFEHNHRQWELKSTLLFMMTSVLKSRTETGFESNSAGYDEDVNVYLAGLLAAYLDPAYTQWSTPLISPFDTDVATMARSADERRRYWIYKANADHLMLMLGIFEPESPAAPLPSPPAGAPGSPGAPSPTPPPAVSIPNLPPGRTRMYVGRGETYYELAASYGRGLARRPTAAVEVLEKLAGGFEGYVTILNHLRSHYFNLIERMHRRDMDAIQEAIDDQAVASEFKAKVDQLLDLYSAWRESRDPALIAAMRQAVAAIRQIDPGFQFELPA